MENKLENLIKTFTFLNPNPVVILNDSYEIIYKSEDCETKVFLEYIKKLKKIKDDETTDVLSNGNTIKTSKVVVCDNTYYISSVEKINSNPNNYEDPLLAKISFFLDYLEDGVSILKNNEVIFRNDSIFKLIGMPESKKDSEHYSTYVKHNSLSKLRQIIENEDKGDLVLKLHSEDEGIKWIATGLSKLILNDDVYHIVSIKDITDQKKQEEEYKAQKEYLSHTLNSIGEGVIICDENDKITLFNEVASLISGVSEKEALTQNILNVIRIINETEEIINYIQEENYKNDDCLLFSIDGLIRHVSLNISNIVDDQANILGKVIIIIDISETKKREKEILYLSYHDILTGLYNRTYLDHEIKRLDTKRQIPFAVLMGDVNGLKITNDVFGHDAGDNLLRKVSEILKRSCRHEDIIGRWGGDEFIMLLPNTTEEEVYLILKRIIRDFEGLEKRDSINGLLPSMSLGYGVKTSENESIYETLKVAENNMYKRKMLSSESIHSSIITSMKTTLNEKSNETEEHTNRLFDLCNKVGKRYNISSEDTSDLELLCMLHDIGKIGISDTIISKPGKLNEEEWTIMKTHPEIGFRIAKATPELKKVSDYILYHHEKFDGTGYPKGLKKYKIPLLDRILSVVDAYDAMTNDRVYRKAMSKEEALKEIISNSGTQFDSDVVKIFLEELK